MEAADNNIFPVFGDLMQRHHKEAQLKQRACAFWLTGLSGSGKTTIAKGLEKELHRLGFFTQVLDGDNIRAGLNGNLGFSEEDRTENIRRIGEVSKLFVDAGIVTINCFVSPTRAIRAQARDIIGNDDFFEVFVNTPLEICEQRDVKGLYVKARAGEIKNFTGIDAPFEAPEHPSIDLKTADQSVDESVAELLNFVLEHIKYGD
jgi:adenylylsulfate kinase